MKITICNYEFSRPLVEKKLILHDQFILHASQASFMVVLATTSVVQKILLNDVKLVLIYTYDQTKFVSRTILIDALA